MKFRKDINGLRAIAVMAVVIFHFNSTWLPGGFVGVDVFFVISGYLMTSIIFRGMKNKTFNIFKFYESRANRIIPPLLFLVLFSLIIGYVFLIKPTDFSTLAKHSYSSLGFFSNFTYWLESGYFDASPKDKWLLHTWSLSVEWQFYLIYPLMLVLINKVFPIPKVKIFIVFLCSFLFAFNVYSTLNWPDSSYYLITARAWEMMVGGVAFLYPIHLNKRTAKGMELLGFSLIVLSCVFLSENYAWPGYYALIPVLGTYFVILSNSKDSMVNSSIVQSIGTWSYSIYLWHWLLVVLLFLFGFNENISMQVFMIILSVFFGFLSYAIIEKQLKIKDVWWLYVALVVLSIYISFNKIGTLRSGYLDSVVASMVRGDYPCFDNKDTNNRDNFTCNLSNGKLKILALGDSHMYSSIPSLDHVANNNDYHLEYVGFSGCPPILDVYPIRSDQKLKNCHYLNEKSVEYAIQGGFDIVYLAARWTYYTDGDYNGMNIQYLSSNNLRKIKNKDESIMAFKVGIYNTLKKYHDNDIKVVILLQVPMQKIGPDKIYFESTNMTGFDVNKVSNLSVSREEHIAFQNKANNILKETSLKFDNITLIDPSELYCDEKVCPVGNSTNSFYFDRDHLSIQGAEKLENKLSETLSNLTKL